jgi:choline dehydrogenase-like flavoprotein
MPDLTESVPTDGWDAIVVGTGIGGATLGHALAAGGWRVLFCEKGKTGSAARDLRGDYAEHFLPAHANLQHVLARAGRTSDFVLDRMHGDTPFVPFTGSGAGGSSALYGMAMERFHPVDFAPRASAANAEETTLPDRWPVAYEDFAPHYAAAERLYRVRGTADPLRSDDARALPSPPPLSPRGQALSAFLEKKGMHVYRVPLACEFAPGCRCCQGYLCPANCKVDSARACLAPAIERHGAALLDDCNVLRLTATRRDVTEVVCERRGEILRLRGTIVVLAAGALATPGILLASTSDAWPDGLANRSGLVGRNLMRHFNDLYALFLPDTAADDENRQKELAFSDFYAMTDAKFGTVQSFGRLPPADVILRSLCDDARAGRQSWRSGFVGLASPVIAPFVRRIVARSTVLATIVDDPPYADNRVTLTAHSSQRGARTLAIDYRIRPSDRARIARQRALMRDLLKPLRFKLIKQAENARLLAHACGTCRFGNDPQTSVLDADNRAHGLDNLYVVDASFMPSSGGTNPGLTIAANALRVAGRLLGHSVAPMEASHGAA